MVCPFSTLGCTSQHREKLDSHLILLLHKILDIEQKLIEVDGARHLKTTAQRDVAASGSFVSSAQVCSSAEPGVHGASQSAPHVSRRSSTCEDFFQEVQCSAEAHKPAVPKVDSPRALSSYAGAKMHPLFLDQQRESEHDVSAHVSSTLTGTTQSTQQGGSSSSTNTGRHQGTSPMVFDEITPVPPSVGLGWPSGKPKTHQHAMPHANATDSAALLGELSASQQRVNRLVRRQNKKAACAGVALVSRRSVDNAKKRSLGAYACASTLGNSSQDEDNDEERAAQMNHCAARMDLHDRVAPLCAAERTLDSNTQLASLGRAAKVAKVNSAPYSTSSAPNMPRSGSGMHVASNISIKHHALPSWNNLHPEPPSNTRPCDGYALEEKLPSYDAEVSLHGGRVSAHGVPTPVGNLLANCCSDKVLGNPGLPTNAPNSSVLAIPSILHAQSHHAQLEDVKSSVVHYASEGEVTLTPSSPLAMDHDFVTRQEDDPYVTNHEDSVSPARHSATARTFSTPSKRVRHLTTSSDHRKKVAAVEPSIPTTACSSGAIVENDGRDRAEISGPGPGGDQGSRVDGAKDGRAAMSSAFFGNDAFVGDLKDDALARQLARKYTKHRLFEGSGTQPMDIDSMMQSPSGSHCPNFTQPIDSTCGEEDLEADSPTAKKKPRADGHSALSVSKKLLRKKITYTEALERFLLFDKLPDSDALNAALCAMQVLPPEDETAIKLLDGIKSEAAKLKARLYRAKIFRNIAKNAADAAPHLVDALTQYVAVIENDAAKPGDRQKAISARDSIIYQLKKERLGFTDQVREQARKLPKPVKVVSSENKWTTQGETVDLDLNLCSCRIKVGCKHMCVVYGAEGGTSLKDRTKDQLRALLKLNNMSTASRSHEEMVKLLMDAKALGGAAPPCPKCGSYTDEENGLFRCRKNREGKARKCDFFASEPRIPLRGL